MKFLLPDCSHHPFIFRLQRKRRVHSCGVHLYRHKRLALTAGKAKELGYLGVYMYRESYLGKHVTQSPCI